MSENDWVKVQKCQTMDQKFVMSENGQRKLKNVRKKIKKV